MAGGYSCGRRSWGCGLRLAAMLPRRGARARRSMPSPGAILHNLLFGMCRARLQACFGRNLPAKLASTTLLVASRQPQHACGTW